MGRRQTIRDGESDQDGLLRMPGATLPGMIGSRDRAVCFDNATQPKFQVHDDTGLGNT